MVVDRHDDFEWYPAFYEILAWKVLRLTRVGDKGGGKGELRYAVEERWSAVDMCRSLLPLVGGVNLAWELTNHLTMRREKVS